MKKNACLSKGSPGTPVQMPEGEPNYVCTLPPKIQQIAYDELNEDPATRDRDIEAIREWIKKQPYLRARTDNLSILWYLRGCKFSQEKTKSKLDVYYTCKTAYTELFHYRDPNDPRLQPILHMNLMVPLPGYDDLGRKVILGRLGVWDPARVRPEDLFRAASLLFDVLFREDEQMSVTGFVQVQDMAGISFKHATALTLPLIKKVMTMWTEGYPSRPKAVHYINTTPAFDTIFNLFRPFMKEKIKNRIFNHGNNIEALFKKVPREMFPSEYGGSAGSLKEMNDVWVDKIKSRRDWFLEDQQYGIDTSKRPSKYKRIIDPFGSTGSFRRLEVD